MDTTPFHLILAALDIFVLGGLFLWIRFRRNTGSVRTEVYKYEKSLYAPVVTRHASFIWDASGVILFGGFWFTCFGVMSRLLFTDFVQKNIYYFNAGQCVVEGLAVHGTLVFFVTGALLFWNRRRILASLFVLTAVCLAALSFDVLYWEPYHLKIEYYTIKTKKLETPLRIVFVSDIQTDCISSHEINTLKTIQRLQADLIILGGDYTQTFLHTREKQLTEKFRQMLLDYPLEAPLGVYAIPGNIGIDHDSRLFKDTSVNFVQSSVTFYDKRDDEKRLGPIDLTFLDLGHSRGNLVLEESDNFVVYAGHYPNYAVDGYTNPKSGKSLSGFRKAAKAPDLMLAGHTHGGQIVIPFYGPLPWGGDGYVKQIPRHMLSGFFTYDNGGHVLITRGSGLERGWAPRIRLFCPAEISVIDVIPE